MSASEQKKYTLASPASVNRPSGPSSSTALGSRAGRAVLAANLEQVCEIRAEAHGHPHAQGFGAEVAHEQAFVAGAIP